MTKTDPTILKVIPRRNGIAGEYRLSAVVQYDGEAPETVMFKSSVYGGPIVAEGDYCPECGQVGHCFGTTSA